jgi:hypothetical protein
MPDLPPAQPRSPRRVRRRLPRPGGSLITRPTCWPSDWRPPFAALLMTSRLVPPGGDGRHQVGHPIPRIARTVQPVHLAARRRCPAPWCGLHPRRGVVPRRSLRRRVRRSRWSLASPQRVVISWSGMAASSRNPAAVMSGRPSARRLWPAAAQRSARIPSSVSESHLPSVPPPPLPPRFPPNPFACSLPRSHSLICLI